jgi:hypothetical protein
VSGTTTLGIAAAESASGAPLSPEDGQARGVRGPLRVGYLLAHIMVVTLGTFSVDSEMLMLPSRSSSSSGDPMDLLAGAMSVSFFVLFLVPVLALATLAGMAMTVILNRLGSPY